MSQLDYTSQYFNLATNTKWIADIPFQKFRPDLKSYNITFNLTKMTLPEISQGMAEFKVGGETMPIGLGNRTDSKTITFNYVLSSDWHQFHLLYDWFNIMSNEHCIGTGTYTTMSDYMTDITVTLISEFKNPIMTITYHDSWLQSIAEVDADYQNVEDSVINHSFTIKYSRFTIVNHLQTLSTAISTPC